jgi:hypothetical protein
VSDGPRDIRWNEAEPELPSELGELLRSGRDRLGTPEEVAELGRRLCAALGPAAGLTVDGQPAPVSGTAGTAAPSPSGISAVGAASRGVWAVASTGALLAIGIAAFVFLRSSNTPAPSSAPAPTQPVIETASSSAPGKPASAASPPAATALPAPPPAADEIDPGSAAMADRAAASRALPRGKARPAAAPRRAGSETALLEQARAALHSRPALALELTRRHQARFPRGVLAQEREVIAIEALERLGRKDAADARAAEFERRFRGSVHQPRLLRGADTSAPAGGD